ncbi:MAG: alpha/beta hydrolase family protein [Acidobacteriota bacterium]
MKSLTISLISISLSLFSFQNLLSSKEPFYWESKKNIIFYKIKIKNASSFSYYYKPSGIKEKIPIIIILPHLSGGIFIEKIICKKFAKEKIATLLIEEVYQNEYNFFKAKKSITGDKSLNMIKQILMQSLNDIEIYINWVRKQPEIDNSKIGILGISMGAIVGSVAIARLQCFNKAVLILGGADIPYLIFHSSLTKKLRAKLIKEKISEENIKEILNQVDPLNYSYNGLKSNILMVNAIKDKIIPKKCVEELHEALGNPEIMWLNGGHYSSIFYFFKILDKSIKFFKNP